MFECAGNKWQLKPVSTDLMSCFDEKEYFLRHIIYDDAWKKPMKEKENMKTEINVEFEMKKKIDEMVLDMIEDVRIIVPNKVVEVTFRDGDKEKAVCAEEDTYSFDTAIAICIAKYFLGGTKDYCTVVKNANKIIANKEKEAEKARIAEQQKAKRIAKFEAYKKKKAAKKLENEIELRKEAYKRAIKELEEEKQAASCE